MEQGEEVGKEEERQSANEPVGQIQKVTPEASELIWMLSRQRGTKQSCEEVNVSQNQLPKTVHTLCNKNMKPL